MFHTINRERFLNSLATPTEHCAICHEEYDTNEHKPVRVACGHWFGESCLRGTVDLSPAPNACPNCRADMYQNSIAVASGRDLRLREGRPSGAPVLSNSLFPTQDGRDSRVREERQSGASVLSNFDFTTEGSRGWFGRPSRTRVPLISPVQTLLQTALTHDSTRRIDADNIFSRLRHVSDADGAAFVQYIWPILRPYAVQHLLTSSSDTEATQSIAEQYQPMINELFRRLDELDGDMPIIRSFIIAAHASPQPLEKVENKFFNIVCLSIPMLYLEEIPASSATLMWRMLKTTLADTAYSKFNAFHYAAMIESMLIALNPIMPLRFWFYVRHSHNWRLQEPMHGVIRKEVQRLHTISRSPEQLQFIGAESEIPKVVRLLNLPVTSEANWHARHIVWEH